jgi:hypothetical protein
MTDITIRNAYDREVLARLAALDSSAPLSGDALVAESDGRAVAAIELGSGRTVADPFVRTADVVELLRLRARGAPGLSRRRISRRTHFLPKAA